jgi:hypothetical protein
MPLGWYDYVMLGVVVLIPALQLWLAWTVRQHYDLPLSFACLSGFTLAGWLAWFVVILLFAYTFAFCCFEGTPLRVALTKNLYYNTLAAPITFDFWAVPLFLLLVGLMGFALAKFRIDKVVLVWSVVSFIAFVAFAANTRTLDGVVPEAKGVPLYPGTERGWVDREGSSWFNWRDISLVVPAEPEVVRSFYKRELPKGRWQLLSEGGSPYDLEFVRLDTEGDLSWRFRLVMENRPATEEDGGGKTDVAIEIFRLPDMQKLPVYPDAHDAKVTEELFTGDVIRRTTLYTVSAQPGDVEAWYRSILLKAGAWDDETERSDQREGLFFSYYRDGTRPGGRVANIVVIARQNPGGQTEVELRGIEYPFPYYIINP